jgi:hypothetical protein
LPHDDSFLPSGANMTTIKNEADKNQGKLYYSNFAGEKQPDEAA